MNTGLKNSDTTVQREDTVAQINEKKSKIKANLKYMRDRDREPVKGIFRYHEVEGGSMSFSYKAYKEDPVENYELYDGQVYTVPFGVAKHLNKNGWYPVHAYTTDENGKPSMKVGQKVRRFSFQSLEFVDLDDLTPVGGPLITVESI
mgnify:CR=1 FL=1